MQCRRGLLELDLLLGGFVERRYAGLSAAEQDAFRRLLAQSDPALLAWIQGQESPPDDLKCIIEKIVQ
jgi:antitoxin CptB